MKKCTKNILATVMIALPFGLLSNAFAEPLPFIRLGALEFGTVNWELDTIKNNQLDKVNGFDLEVVPMGSGDAADIAFLGGEIDAIVSDWLWVATQRAEGRDFKFIPYSTSVGGIMVKPESGISALEQLKGKTIGVAGGPLDKSWLIIQAYAAQQGIDLSEITQQEFGSPPLMFKAALKGDVDAVVNFWHFQAKAQAAGFVEFLSVQDAARSLGLDPSIPLLGYVVNADMRPELAQGLFRASRAAKQILGYDDGAFDAVRHLMNADNDLQFEALKAGFREGIPESVYVDKEAASRMLVLMAELGGKDLVGKATALPDDLFVKFVE